MKQVHRRSRDITTLGGTLLTPLGRSVPFR
jgi:hypothetical protein